jgi:hypothetical protein
MRSPLRFLNEMGEISLPCQADHQPTIDNTRM